MDIQRIPERFMRANSYVIRIGDSYTLVDPGIAPAALDQALGEDEHRKVRRLVVTHGHYDHIVYIDLWREESDVPLYMHEDAMQTLQDPELNASVVFGREERYRPTQTLLRESGRIPLEEGYYLTAISLPGHTEGDIALTLRHEEGKDPLAVFTGDIIFEDSVGRTDFPGSDPRKQERSLERLARLLMIWPAATPVYAGHGKPFTVGDLLISNPYITAAAEKVKKQAGFAVRVPENGGGERSFQRGRRPLVIGYVGTNDLKDVSIPDALDLDIINIAFGVVREGKAFWKPDEAAVEALNTIRAINPSIRIVLSVGGWSAGGFSEAASTEEGRRLFAESCVELVEMYDLDGVDIDWEYPGSSAGGIASSADDKWTFTLYLQAIRDALDGVGGRYRQLTIAAGGNPSYIERTEMDKVQAILDYVQIMTYDLSAGYGKFTGHHTNLYPSKLYRERLMARPLPEKLVERFGEEKAAQFMEQIARSSADNSVKAYLEAGVPADKLVIGAAFYSRSFRGVTGDGDGLGMESTEDATSGQVYDLLFEEYINKNGFVRHWDEEARAPWLFNGDMFITYDDPQSIAAKAEYTIDSGLLGVMYWEYGCAKKYSLNRVLRTELDRARQRSAGSRRV